MCMFFLSLSNLLRHLEIYWTHFCLHSLWCFMLSYVVWVCISYLLILFNSVYFSQPCGTICVALKRATRSHLKTAGESPFLSKTDRLTFNNRVIFSAYSSHNHVTLRATLRAANKRDAPRWRRRVWPTVMRVSGTEEHRRACVINNQPKQKVPQSFRRGNAALRRGRGAARLIHRCVGYASDAFCRLTDWLIAALTQWIVSSSDRCYTQ